MNLFHAISTYQLLEMIIYKLKFHQEEKSVLIITDTLVEKFPCYGNLKKFFDDIIIYNIAPPINKNKQLVESVKVFFENLFENNNLKVTDFTNIHVGCAHLCFGIYLESNKVPFIFFEDAAGLKSHPEILLNIEKTLSLPEMTETSYKLGLYDGTAKSVQKIVCNHNSQTDEVKATTEHFDVVEEFLKLPVDLQMQIRSFFTDVKNFDVPKDCVLFLTQHFANLKILSFDDQILIYQMVMDYFFKDKKVVFKPHPDDIMYYGMLFPECQIIREKFPSEFLPVMFENKPKTIATISSTAIFNLYNFFDDSFALDTKVEKDFRALHRYYTALMLYKKCANTAQLIGIGDNKLVTKELCKAEGIVPCDNGKKFYIIDDIETEEGYSRDDIIRLTEELDDNSAIVFINFKQDFCFYDIEHKDLWKNIVPVCIKKNQIENAEFCADTDTEVIYFYSKNKEYKQMAENLNFDKKLEHTGIELSIEKLTPEQERIKVLEGILEATEKRLLYYIKQVENNGSEGK